MNTNYITPPPLYAILSLEKDSNMLELALKMLAAELEWIQIRNKNILPDLDYKEFLIALKKNKESISPNSKLIINDDPHLAKELEAEGVHLGQSDMSAELAREILGKNAIIGLSTNKLEQVRSAPLKVLTYLACGPVYNSLTKFGHAEPIGTEGVKLFTRDQDIPFVAIGGINLSLAPEVYTAGASSVAMIGELKKHQDNLSAFKDKFGQISKDVIS